MDNQNSANISYIQVLKNVFISKLIHLNIIKTGKFTLKNGTTSDIYMDLRKLISNPALFTYLDKLIKLLYPELLTSNTTDISNKQLRLMPIPMGGLPLGNYLSFTNEIPHVMVRDKPKNHGTKNLIEGVITEDDEFIIIEDVITSGTSIRETLTNIDQFYGTDFLYYKAILCICNRGNLTEINGIPIFSIFTLDEIKKITHEFTNLPDTDEIMTTQFFKYGSYFADKLYIIAMKKKSNIILSCDFLTPEQILTIIRKIGNDIIAVKLHLDTIPGTDLLVFCKELNILQKEMGFLVIEDAKYADIESIMIEKVKSLSNYNVASALTIHGIAGLSVLGKDVMALPGIIVSEMSCSNNLINEQYTREIIEYIRQNYQDHNLAIGGLVVQNKVPKMLDLCEMPTMSPGISITMTEDGANQKYSIPELRNNKLGLFWIVGRGITKYSDDHNIITIMEKYKKMGWEYFIAY
jgi:uridine monophosphate synthetase